MDIRMRYVKMVYEQRSFTRAAEKLFISQPSLSAMVKKVEAELGTAIFDRGTTPLELTEAGQAYIEYIEEIEQNEALLNEKLWDIQNLNKGHISVGGSNYILANILPLILQCIMPYYPGIVFETVEENSFSLHQMLLSGALDFVIDSSSTEDSSLSYHNLFEERILLAVPTQDPINSRLIQYQINVSDLGHIQWKSICLPHELARMVLNRPFILLKSENDMYQRARDVFLYFKLQPQVILYLDQLNTSLQYTAHGLGSSFVTDTLFQYGNHYPNICLYAIDTPSCQRKLCVVHKRGKYISKAGKLFIQTAQKLFFVDIKNENL